MTQIDPTVIAVIAIIGLATFVRSAIGFGDALIAMGLTTSLIGLQTATPLVALMGTAISIGILMTQWEKLQIKSVLPLVIATLIGIPLGLGLLKLVPEAIARAVLGVVLISYGTYGALGLKLPTLTSDRPAAAFGFVAGVLGGAYNTSGLVIAIYGTLKRWQPDEFQLTLQSYFFFTNFMVLAGHALSGLWTPRVWSLFLMSLPMIGVAVLLGDRANRHIKHEWFTKLVFSFLLLVGFILLAQTVF